ncbi:MULTISPECIES: hypothetical protein [unclassified Leifsonia]|nr:MULTISPECIES: hypothetical protein [unclassified Leifsonia]SEH81446.1 hypothetical protein SAMN04515694_104207 [Leifsonia sp. CL154]SFL43959.1 hypothetical protein SAMN04515692_104206 [Leifsonia sp. CL147]
MDPLTSLALTVTIAAVALCALYWVIRRAVAAGIRDARSGNGKGAAPVE